MTRHVLLFERRFVEPLVARTKLHTIRPPRKRPIAVGDFIDMRYWAGKPYRSKQVKIGGSVVTAVRTIRLERNRNIPCVDFKQIEINGVALLIADAEALAARDGFSTLGEMLDWHAENYGLGRDLTLIEWG